MHYYYNGEITFKNGEDMTENQKRELLDIFDDEHRNVYFEEDHSMIL